MRYSFFYLLISLLYFSSCGKKLDKNVYAEGIYERGNFKYALIHKTSHCPEINKGIIPKDTINIFWWNDSYPDGVSIMYCSNCLTDSEIVELQEHRKNQETKYYKSRIRTDSVRIELTNPK